MRGFLPAQNPLLRLPPAFAAWEEVAPHIPSLLNTAQLRPTLAGLPLSDLRCLEEPAQWQRAMLLLSLFGQAYVWGTPEPATHLPAALAVPWCQVAEHLGRPPIASHASMVLSNWRLRDPAGPLEVENLEPLVLFTGTPDEAWFYMLTVAIEATGAPALLDLVAAQQAVSTGQVETVAGCLTRIAAVLERLEKLLNRMPEKCRPAVFYHRLRPFLTGWPEPGLLYEGVSKTPQVWAGGSAAQSSLLQALDAGLGLQCQEEAVRAFLREMWHYMPPPHRRFLQALQDGPSIRQFVLDRRRTHPALGDLYNECVRGLDRFRRAHLAIAVRYILQEATLPDQARGTGGSHFMTLLRAVWTQTKEGLI